METTTQTAAAVDRAAREAHAGWAAVWRLGFACGLEWSARVGRATLEQGAAGPAEVARVQALARARGLAPCARSAEAGLRAAIAAVRARVAEIEREG